MKGADRFRQIIAGYAQDPQSEAPPMRTIEDVKKMVISIMTTKPLEQRRPLIESYVATVQLETLFEIRDALYELCYGMSELRGHAETANEDVRWRLTDAP